MCVLRLLLRLVKEVLRSFISSVAKLVLTSFCVFRKALLEFSLGMFHGLQTAQNLFLTFQQ